MGHEVTTLNRGYSTPSSPATPQRLVANSTDPQSVRKALAGTEFDAVVQFTGYLPGHVHDDVETFASAGHYVYISSASVYQKPPTSWWITEETSVGNPYWDYARDKIACEDVLRTAQTESAFPVTIIRPSLTYGLTQIPVPIGSWDRPYTLVERMRQGLPIIVPGDGTSLFTITHNSDFAQGLCGLLGQREAVGETFNITSDEALSWNAVYESIAAAAGVTPNFLHIPSDALAAAHHDEIGNLWGDKAHSSVFDTSKIRRFIPDFSPATQFKDGITQTIQWFDADPARRTIDTAAHQMWDRMVSIYQDALQRSVEVSH